MHTNTEFDEDDLQLNTTLEDFEELNTSHPLAVSTEFDRKSKRRSQILGDRRTIITYENGEELTEHEDGTIEQSTFDGSRIQINSDTKTETTKDGIILTTDLKTGRRLRQETPDGVVIEFKEDGSTIEIFPDSTVITKFRDGTIKEVNHDLSI